MVGPSVFVFIRMVLRPQRKNSHVRSVAAFPRDEAEDDNKDGLRRISFNSQSPTRISSDARLEPQKSFGLYHLQLQVIVTTRVSSDL